MTKEFRVGQVWADAKNRNYEICTVINNKQVDYPVIALHNTITFSYSLHGEYILGCSSEYDLIKLIKDVKEQPNLKRHKHADVIHAWAEGEAIQVRYADEDDWEDFKVNDPEFDSEMWEWRIKPKTLKSKYRMALTTEGVKAIDITNTDKFIIIDWIGDIVEV